MPTLDSSLSGLDRIQHKKDEDLKAKKKRDAEIKRRALAMNGVFNTENGAILWQHLVDYCGLMAHDQQLNPAKLIEDRGKRAVLLDGIWKYLDLKTKAKLEYK